MKKANNIYIIVAAMLLVIGAMEIRDASPGASLPTRVNNAAKKLMKSVPIYTSVHLAELHAHHAKGLLIRCIDFRFGTNGRQAMIEGLKIKDFDEVAIAGASQALVDPLDPSFRTTVLKHIELAKSLHGIDTVVFEDHTAAEESGCGAYKAKYPELKDADATAEEAKHVEVLLRARDEIKALHPDLKVITVIIKAVKMPDGTVRDEVREVS